MVITHLADGAIGLQEVGLEVSIEQVASDALNGVINGQHMDALAVLNVSALRAHQVKGNKPFNMVAKCLAANVTCAPETMKGPRFWRGRCSVRHPHMHTQPCKRPKQRATPEPPP